MKHNGCEHHYSVFAVLFLSFQPNTGEEQNQNDYLSDQADSGDKLIIIHSRSPHLDLRRLTYKMFTLTHLSLRNTMVVSQRVLKAFFAHSIKRYVTGGSQSWNIVRILGKTNAKARTSNFTSYSKEKNCPSASSVGAR